MNYENKLIDLPLLIVNIENPRFEMVGNQREAITNMIENQKRKLENLGQDIVNNGLNPSELVIVSPHEKHKGQYNVLEGNRRVIALKLLANPELIPDKNKSTLKRFEKLSEQFLKNQIERINCVVFENESDANKWIILKHTGENEGIGTVQWNAQQKARFEERIKGKTNYAIQIINFLNNRNDIGEDQKSNLKKVPSSSLQRLATDPDFRRIVGIDIKNNKVVTKYEPSEIVKPLLKVIKDLLRTDFTVKDIYFKDDRLNYLETFKSTDLPDKTYELSGYWELTSPNPPDISKAIKKRKRSKKALHKRDNIIPKSTIIHISQPRVNKIYRELKDLDLRYFVNAGAITFRVFIELSADTFIEDMNIPNITINDRLIKKINVVANYLQDNNHLDKHKLKGIRTAVSNPNDIMSIDTFNSYVHNKDFHPDPNNLKLTWDNIELFILKIWELI